MLANLLNSNFFEGQLLSIIMQTNISQWAKIWKKVASMVLMIMVFWNALKAPEETQSKEIFSKFVDFSLWGNHATSNHSYYTHYLLQYFSIFSTLKVEVIGYNNLGMYFTFLPFCQLVGYVCYLLCLFIVFLSVFTPY